MTDDQLKTMIEGHEARVNRIYLDSENNPTCGVGHLLAIGSKVPEKAVQAFFDMDFEVAVADYLSLMRQYNLNLESVRRAVLINMLFNMGINQVQGFRKMLAALSAEDYERAADEMIDSRWYNQVGNRARELEKMMREG